MTIISFICTIPPSTSEDSYPDFPCWQTVWPGYTALRPSESDSWYELTHSTTSVASCCRRSETSNSDAGDRCSYQPKASIKIENCRIGSLRTAYIKNLVRQRPGHCHTGRTGKGQEDSRRYVRGQGEAPRIRIVLARFGLPCCLNYFNRRYLTARGQLGRGRCLREPPGRHYYPSRARQVPSRVLQLQKAPRQV